MSRRDLSQPSSVDALVSGYGKVGGFLDRIERGSTGRGSRFCCRRAMDRRPAWPRYPPLAMFKILLLQQWRTLSDPAAEEAARDRLSFRRFCGLPLDVETPDHASIWRFRQTIDKLSLSTKLLAEVTPAARRPRLRHQARHAGRCDHHRRLRAAALRGRRRQSARRRGAFHAQARQDLFWLQGASGGGRGKRPRAGGLDDPGQCARQPSGRSAHPGRRAGLFRRKGRAYDSQALRQTLERRGLVDGIA